MRQTALLQAKNAFEILTRLPRHGMGSKLSRTSWGDDTFWTVSRVRVSPDGKHGTAWGVLTWKGEPQRPDAPTRLAGPLKPVWRLLGDADGSTEQRGWTSELAAVLQQEKAAAAAAEAPTAAAEEEAPVAAAAEEQPAAA